MYNLMIAAYKCRFQTHRFLLHIVHRTFRATMYYAQCVFVWCSLPVDMCKFQICAMPLYQLHKKSTRLMRHLIVWKQILKNDQACDLKPIFFNQIRACHFCTFFKPLHLLHSVAHFCIFCTALHILHNLAYFGLVSICSTSASSSFWSLLLSFFYSRVSTLRLFNFKTLELPIPVFAFFLLFFIL